MCGLLAQGQAHAENEGETQAIAALLKAIHVDPYNLEVCRRMCGGSSSESIE